MKARIALEAIKELAAAEIPGGASGSAEGAFQRVPRSADQREFPRV